MIFKLLSEPAVSPHDKIDVIFPGNTFNFTHHGCKTLQRKLLFNRIAMNIKIILCMIVLMSCSTPEYTNSFVIDTSCDLSVVEGELNGRRAYFLLDTGAGITCVDLNQGKEYGFTSAETDDLIGGFTNEQAKVKLAIGIHSITINGIDIHDGAVYTNKMDNLVQFISNCSHKRISGIIGAPLIKKYGLVIDLTNSRLFKVN